MITQLLFFSAVDSVLIETHMLVLPELCKMRTFFCKLVYLLFSL